jgi:putative hydrolase of the HAD superfamily
VTVGDRRPPPEAAPYGTPALCPPARISAQCSKPKAPPARRPEALTLSADPATRDGYDAGVKKPVAVPKKWIVPPSGKVWVTSKLQVTTDFFAALGAHCERLGLPHDSFRNLVTADPEGRQLYHQVERGELSQPAFEQRIAQLLGVQPTGLIQGLLADLRPEPLMAEAVERTRTVGIPVGVITNSWGTAPYDPYTAYQLNQRFDAVVISSQVGLRKPEPAIYRRAAHELAVPTERIVFVDDIAANLQPAQELGMAVIHHVDPARTVRELERLLGLSDRLLRRP